MATEFRIRCSGKGKAWHMQGSNRAHSHVKKSRAKAAADAEQLNKPTMVPLGRECQPWVIESREVSRWSLDKDDTIE